MSNSFDFDSFYSGDSDPFDDDGQYVDTQNLIAENAEFGNWLFQLQEACTADRLEDIEAIASMQCPKQVVLRRFTRYGPPPIENDQDSFLSNKSTRLEHRDELLPIAAMYMHENCPPLPNFPPADSEAGSRVTCWECKNASYFTTCGRRLHFSLFAKIDRYDLRQTGIGLDFVRPHRSSLQVR